jgi:hypothetical protein
VHYGSPLFSKRFFFAKNFVNLKKVRFMVLTESNHPGDVFDNARDDCCRRFDCIDPDGSTVTENFKPLTGPAVKEVKEVSL